MTFQGFPLRCAGIMSSISPSAAAAALARNFTAVLMSSLAVLTSLSVFFSLFALAVLHAHQAAGARSLQHAWPRYLRHVPHAGLCGIAGVCFSVIALALVLTATPAPSYLGGIAAERARILEERLPEAFERLPNAIKSLRPR